MRLVEFSIYPKYLKIILLPAGREFLSEEPGHPDIFLDLIDWQLCNGWEIIQPEEIGALTSATILSNETDRDDYGVLTKVGDLYWHDRYQIEDPVDELLETGHVIFMNGFLRM